MKFMLLDVLELRKANWESKEADKGPKTLAEIHEEMQKQQMEKDAAAARASQRQRPQAGRGDGRAFSQGFGMNAGQNFQDQRQNQTLGSDDLKRLGAKSIRQSTGGPSFGPPTSFGRSGSGGGNRKGLGISNSLGSIFSPGDSSASSRTGTPPIIQRDPIKSTNSFSLLSGHGDGADVTEGHDSGRASSSHEVAAAPDAKASLESSVVEKDG